MVVTLVGYRGSGKTSIARPLAERLGLDWIDVDAEVERRSGRTIADIFSEDGESSFRRLERETLVDLLGRGRLVVAAGGGAVLDADSRREMGAAGPVVWLRCSVERLAERIAADASTGERRPSLSGAGVLDEIGPLLREREPLYLEASTLIVETDDCTPSEIAERVAAELRATENGSLA